MAAAPKKRSRKKHRKYMTTEEAIRHVLHPKDMCCIRRTCAASEGHVLHPNDMCCIRMTCAASEGHVLHPNFVNTWERRSKYSTVNP
jgi:hypothetical protein